MPADGFATVTLRRKTVDTVKLHLWQRQLPFIEQLAKGVQISEDRPELRPSVSKFVEDAVIEKLNREAPVATSGVTTLTMESVNGEAKK